MEELEKLFRSHSLRLTEARRAVFQALEQVESPLYISEIIAACSSHNRTSVYRTLDTFTKLSIVETIATGWKQRYELSDLFRAHHHHLQCTRCGELVSIDTPGLEASISAIAQTHDYQLTSHHIELHGICNKCLRNERGAAV